MQRHRSLYGCCAMVMLLGLAIVWTPVQASATTTEQQPTAFAYAALALSKALDAQYPFLRLRTP
jgi:hypothetical protein